MRLMFVYWPYESAGSATDLYNYSRTARAFGHEVVVYGPPDDRLSFPCSLDVQAADFVIFVLEWNLYLHHGGRLNLVRLLAQVPRNHRLIFDCDGMYNDRMDVEGDSNFQTDQACHWRKDLYEQLSAAIFQPTLHPQRSNVGSFLFHGYNPDWEMPLDVGTKPFSMVYLGNNWFRWRPLRRVLQAIEPIRPRLGRIGLIGKGWDAPSYWDQAILPHDAFHTDPAYLRSLGVDILAQVPYREVVHCMSQATINPVIYRPLFTHLQLVTCRTFETLAANTIPLFGFADAFVRDIYGQQAVELAMNHQPTDKILDVLDRPEHYLEVVRAVRQHLTLHHSYTARLQQLLEILQVQCGNGGNPGRGKEVP